MKNIYDTLISKAGNLWTDYIKHPISNKLADGTLNIERFQYYLGQDYIYLITYGNFFKHMCLNANTDEEREYFINNTIEDLEGGLERDFNVDVSNIKISNTTQEYVDYLLYYQNNGTPLEKLVVLAPCFIGYGLMGEYILEIASIDDNPFQKWIDTYSGNDYQKGIKQYIELINKYEVSEDELDNLSKIFNKVCKLEINFFDQSL